MENITLEILYKRKEQVKDNGLRMKTLWQLCSSIWQNFRAENVFKRSRSQSTVRNHQLYKLQSFICAFLRDDPNFVDLMIEAPQSTAWSGLNIIPPEFRAEAETPFLCLFESRCMLPFRQCWSKKITTSRLRFSKPFTVTLNRALLSKCEF